MRPIWSRKHSTVEDKWCPPVCVCVCVCVCGSVFMYVLVHVSGEGGWGDVGGWRGGPVLVGLDGVCIDPASSRMAGSKLFIF